MSPYFIPERSRLPSTHNINAPVPYGWKCHRFFWAGWFHTPYYHYSTLRLCTTIDMSSNESSPAIPQEVLEGCRGMPYGHEMLVSRVYESDEKDASSSLMCKQIDHINRRVYPFSDGKAQENGDEDQYLEWVRYTHDSHLKLSEEGHCAALSLVVAIQAEHALMPGRSLLMFSSETSNTIMSLLDLKAPDGSRHPSCVRVVHDVLERWAWIGVRQTPEHAFWNLRSPDELTPAQSALFHFVAWTFFLRTPYGFLDRLEKLCEVRDFRFHEAWKPFIEDMRSSWSDLNVVHALILSATTALLNLAGMPGVGGDTIGQVRIAPDPNQSMQYDGTIATGNAPGPNAIPDIARTAGIVTLFLSLSGIISGVVLLTIHIGKTDVGVHIGRPYLLSRHLTIVSLLLSLPLTFLVWSVLSFAISVISWLLIQGNTATNLMSLIIGGASLSGIALVIGYFWDVWSESELKRRQSRGGK